MLPELEHGDVFAIIESVFAEFFVGEHTGNIEQSGLGAVE